MQQNDPEMAGPAINSTKIDMISSSGIRFLSPLGNVDQIDFSDLADWAFFFDLDGTLLDIASLPDAVAPEEGLQAALEALEQRCAGALAIVTGRSVEFVDQLFPTHRFSVAGLHGAQIRLAAGKGGLDDGSAITVSEDFRQALEFARRAASSLAGVIFEDKGGAFALHYRLAPDREAEVRLVMEKAHDLAGRGFSLQPGKFVVELKPSGSDKGAAIHAFMRMEPFNGRRPFATGDDDTDERMFAVANKMGGLSLRVGTLQDAAQSAAVAQIASPQILRRWIRRLTE
ncbi:trehalose-phosphatase [Falsochrobactrum shanghaiense]|uniref:Trehalose 6-phosphate phosphatase n=1 Tax=Falsochrobactrum shanghaiense TaxID=2201899 RepID=A0A316JBL5_9HYPH|nr:trehalose-phosphatase [Falsochrobactrum shanghaiense]